MLRANLACTRQALDLPNGIHYMESDEFEWDDAKAKLNVREHGVTFESARRAFQDPG